MANKKINDLALFAGELPDDMQFETDIGGTTANKVNVLQLKGLSTKAFLALELMGEPTGFNGQLEARVSFDDATRTLSIEPDTPGHDLFIVYVRAQLFIKEALEDFQISDVEGYHYISYNILGNLQEDVNPSNADLAQLIIGDALVAVIGWKPGGSPTTGTHVLYTENNELHGFNMDGATHALHHFFERTKYASGGAMTDIVTDGSGNLDTSAQFGLDSGVAQDEDVSFTIAAVVSTVGAPIYYKGGDITPDVVTNPGFMIATAGTGRAAFNNTSTETLDEVGNNKFVLLHVLGTNNVPNGWFPVVGIAQYDTKLEARVGAANEISNVLGFISVPEAFAVYTRIIQTNDTYGNGVKSRFVSTGDPLSPDFIDWRSQELNAANPAGNHNALSNRQDDGHVQYVLTDTATSRVSTIGEVINYEDIVGTTSAAGMKITTPVANVKRIEPTANADALQFVTDSSQYIELGSSSDFSKIPFGISLITPILQITNVSGAGIESCVASLDGNITIRSQTDGTEPVSLQFNNAIFRSDYTAFGTAQNTHVNLGVAGVTGASSFNYEYCTVSGGYDTRATHEYATAVGGESNYATGMYSAVVGGFENIPSGAHSFIGCGVNNSASNSRSTVAGGNSCTASGSFSTVPGGQTCTASGFSSFATNYYTEASADYSSAFGDGTLASGDASFATGDGTTAAGNESFTMGQSCATSSAAHRSFAGGNDCNTYAVQAFAHGDDNSASGVNATALGGTGNSASGASAFATGDGTLAFGARAFVCGNAGQGLGADSFVMGGSCLATSVGVRSFVGGLLSSVRAANCFSFGDGHLISAGADNSAIAGGDGHSIDSINGFIGGGELSDIDINARNAVILGGIANRTDAADSVLMGTYGNLATAATTSFAFCGAVTTQAAITQPNAFFIFPYGNGSGGVGTTSINASAVWQMDSTTKGMLPPRHTTTTMNNISSPATGLKLYNTTLGFEFVYNGVAWVPSDSGNINLSLVKQSTQSVTTDTDTVVVNYTTEEFNYGFTTNLTTGVVTVLVAGTYHALGTVWFDANGGSADSRVGWFQKNSETVQYGRNSFTIEEDVTVKPACLIKLAVGDEISLSCYQNSGASIDISGSANYQRCEFQMHRIGE